MRSVCSAVCLNVGALAGTAVEPTGAIGSVGVVGGVAAGGAVNRLPPPLAASLPSPPSATAPAARCGPHLIGGIGTGLGVGGAGGAAFQRMGGGGVDGAGAGS